ncbi:MAG: FHA domain-containing protein [Deltaproteobacteria bacterium]|nr:FHA domain-containing protein [Deltaproteobacteria bacterium]
MVRAFMSSLLVRQKLALKAKFQDRYPNPWLVWEPGAWRAPSTDSAASVTRLPTPAGEAKPSKGDALCFELILDARRPALAVGRAPENDIVIPDATVSRKHLELERQAEAWRVKSCSETKACHLNGKLLAPNVWSPLSSGNTIKLGDAELTFLDAKPFTERIEAEAAKLKSI